MKPAISLLSGILFFAFFGLSAGTAQDRVPVTFKVFPPEYEVFFGGERLPFSNRGDGLRSYLLPVGAVRVNLTAPGSAPLSLSLTVKAGMAIVGTKLEPRQGPLVAVGEAQTGKLPRSVAFSLDSKKLFVALLGEAGVEVFEVPSLKKKGRLSIPTASVSGVSDVLAVGPEVWAIQKDGSIQVFDAATLAFKETVSMANSGVSGLTNIGATQVTVANWDNSYLSILEIASRKPQATLALGGSLRGFAFSQGTAYGTLFDQGKIVVIDATTWKVKTSWKAGIAPRPLAAVGTSVFVGDMGNAEVLVLDQASGKVLKAISVASNPHQMAVSADQTLIAVASRGRNNPTDYQLPGPEFGKVTLLDAQGQIRGSVWGRNQPTGLAFSPDGKYLAFTDYLDDNVELYRVTK